MILVIDNYDSFTFNLVQALEVGGATLQVVRNDALDREGLEAVARAAGAGEGAPEDRLAGIVISPAPGSATTVRAFSLVCLHRSRRPATTR